MTKDNIFNSNQLIQSAAGKLQQLATNHILRTHELSGAIKTLVASDIASVTVLLKTGVTVDLAEYSRAHYYRDYTVSDFELFENKIVAYTEKPTTIPEEFTIVLWNRQGVQLKGFTYIWVTYAELRNAFEAVCTNATDHVLGVRLPDRVDEVSSADDHKTIRGNPDIRVEWDSSEAPPAVRELMETAAERASRKTPAVMP